MLSFDPKLPSNFENYIQSKKTKQIVNIADYILKDCSVAILAGLKMFLSYSMAPFQAGISFHGIKRCGKYLNDLSTGG